MVGLVSLALICALALGAPLIATDDPRLVPQGSARLSPSSQHWFGTDQIGRDVFSRVIHGARMSLIIGFGAAGAAGLIGVTIGAVAGYWRGWLDSVLMRIAEVFLVFPSVLLAAAVSIALGPGPGTLIVALAGVGWPAIARVTRGAVGQVAEEEWVEAARALGCSKPIILWRHVLPHAAGPIVVVVALYVATAILGEATLSFLAIGLPEATPSWGSMIAGGRQALASAPHIVLFPAAALFVTVVSLMMVADGIRHALGVDHG